jgi:arylsulfatase A-like enzyme
MTTETVRRTRLFPLAGWFLVVLTAISALAEVLVRYARLQDDPLQHLSPDFPWMAPAALFGIVSAIAALVVIVPSMRHSRTAMIATMFVAVAAVVLNLLMLVPGLAHYAAAVLAAGLAVQAVRVVLGSSPAAERFLRNSAVVALGALIAVSVGVSVAMRPAHRLQDQSGPPSASVPNVVIITLDTVRAANMTPYGYGRETTPRIDAFARRGVVFERASSTAPWTLPSHASMFTGRWPHELSADYAVPLDATHPTLAEFFAGRGYATAGFVANLRYCGRRTGLARGFSHYEDYDRTIGAVASASTLVRTVANNFRARRLIGNDQHLDRITADGLNQRAIAWLGDRPAQPFFMFLNYFDAHEPYLPPPPFDRQFGAARAKGRHSPLHHWLWNPAFGHRPLTDAERQEEVDAYDGSLAYLDSRVGALVDELDRRALLANTIVVITSDHGEEFGEHGVYDHGYSLYRHGVHVPFIVVAPGRAPAGRRVPQPVSLRDLAATVTSLAAPGIASFPGTALAPLWETASTAPSSSASLSDLRRPHGQPDWFPISKGDMRALWTDGFRYVRNGDGREELYAEDEIGERIDLAARPEMAERVRAMRAVVDRLGPPVGLRR